VVLGGTSEIALAIVHELQDRDPREVALVGRDHDALARVAEDLRGAGCPRVLVFDLDARDLGPRPGSTPSHRVSATRCTSRASGSWWCAPA
jgi:short-subunit dehydrogenase